MMDRENLALFLAGFALTGIKDDDDISISVKSDGIEIFINNTDFFYTFEELEELTGFKRCRTH